MSKPRRKRFDVDYTKDGQRKQVEFLAYSEATGRAFLLKRGYTIHSFKPSGQRLRFAVEISRSFERKTEHIMARNATEVRAHYAREGWRVHSCALAAEVARSKPNAGWRLSNAGIQRAAQELGLVLPIRIKQTGRYGNQNAGYSLRCRQQAAKLGIVLPRGANLYHHITAKNYHTPEEANGSLRHELQHAVQAEREIRKALGDNVGNWHALWRTGYDAWQAKTKHQRANWSYDSRPIEIEARRAPKFNFPLAIRG